MSSKNNLSRDLGHDCGKPNQLVPHVVNICLLHLILILQQCFPLFKFLTSVIACFSVHFYERTRISRPGWLASTLPNADLQSFSLSSSTIAEKNRPTPASLAAAAALSAFFVFCSAVQKDGRSLSLPRSLLLVFAKSVSLCHSSPTKRGWERDCLRCRDSAKPLCESNWRRDYSRHSNR